MPPKKDAKGGSKDKGAKAAAGGSEDKGNKVNKFLECRSIKLAVNFYDANPRRKGEERRQCSESPTHPLREAIENP